ncbi:hypothetical protein E3U43_007085 [Larimichthys crocea]|uniref:Uncharacterized protein n=1 Tax=Larimichthys crocea TaxID=215358 RepID=A0ACD3RMI7_LARCR|nr:hypothetical protein E3U43_007085 [Larimichthys crocea]
MRTFHSQSQPAQRGAASSPHSLSGCTAVSPLSTASITFAALLILTIPVCNSAPAELQQATTDQRQILSQIDAMCSSYLSADLKFWASDLLGELCVLMLVQKSKVFIVRKMATFCAGRRQHGLTAGFISWLHENLRYARPSLSFAPDNGRSRNKIKVAETQYEHSKTCLQFLILLLYTRLPQPCAVSRQQRQQQQQQRHWVQGYPDEGETIRG